MLFGLPPFYTKDQNTQKMFQAIREREVLWNSKVKLSDEGKDLILKLLAKDPEERLGTNDAEEIKAHKWFNDINWANLVQKKCVPPFKPKVASDYDTDNFDEEFTSEDAMNSVLPDTNMVLVNKYQKEFKDFTYMPENQLLKGDKE